jgi:ubiquinone/menaquinone biosynthesis C-methylase UbiE
MGAGSGSDAAELLARGAKEVVLVDLSARCVEQLRERADGRWTALQADAENLPFEDDSFDLVFASKLLMHTDAPRVWRESARVLRPGGRACFVEPLQHHPAVVVWRRIAGGFSSVPYRFLSRGEMSAAAGAFRQTEQRGFFFLSPLLYPSPVVQALDEKMLARLPVLQRWAWISALEGLV